MQGAVLLRDEAAQDLVALLAQQVHDEFAVHAGELQVQ